MARTGKTLLSLCRSFEMYFQFLHVVAELVPLEQGASRLACGTYCR